MIARHVSLEGINFILPIFVMVLSLYCVDVISLGQVSGRVRLVSGQGRQLIQCMP